MKLASSMGQRYAFVVAAVAFLILLTTAGVRSAPGLMLVPWENAFGWDRGTISFAAALGIFLYGLIGPFAAALMQSFGVRRTLALALGLMSLSAFLSLFMTESWQLILTWGVLSGIGTGCIAMVLAATIVSRWFVKDRGLVMGILDREHRDGDAHIPAADGAASRARELEIACDRDRHRDAGADSARCCG